MAAQKAYMLGYKNIQPTGNANEFIITFEVALANPDNLTSMVATASLQFIFGTNTNQTIWDAVIAFAATQGYTIIDGGLFVPSFGSVPLANTFEYLGGTTLLADSNSTSTMTITARDFLLISVRCVGMDVTSTPSLRFNGDTGNNYSSRYLSAAAGASTFSTADTINTSFARLTHGNSIGSRSGLVHIVNKATLAKTGTMSYYPAGGGPGIVPTIAFGGFEWANTADQITSILLIAVDGGSKLLAGSGFAVFGSNF